MLHIQWDGGVSPLYQLTMLMEYYHCGGVGGAARPEPQSGRWKSGRGRPGVGRRLALERAHLGPTTRQPWSRGSRDPLLRSTEPTDARGTWRRRRNQRSPAAAAGALSGTRAGSLLLRGLRAASSVPQGAGYELLIRSSSACTATSDVHRKAVVQPFAEEWGQYVDLPKGFVLTTLENLTPSSTVCFCCDMQERFRPTIKYFGNIISVGQRSL
ncbi:PREDICTED: isochorismatase domain-containing protein 1-like [Hipposideros armiger]|uniref:Isochorismatase domain-containing protein 1-like n=1 Tax=Hipposideros armiger TaxID=186990 RepID=A0A8B7SEE9_HIPAR|nr:PREDICTED: isochorismatase domain-containing protein 1-like [Hipposideros armiger]